MSAPVALALILGAGVNIGSHIARTFVAKGYKVALSSRSARDEDSTAGFLNIRGGNVGSELRPGRLHRVAAGLGGPFLSNLPHRETRCNRDPPKPDIDTGGVICCLSGSRVSTKMVNSAPL